MGLFDFFRKKPAGPRQAAKPGPQAGQEDIAGDVRQEQQQEKQQDKQEEKQEEPVPADRNFVDDLVNYFQTKEQVTDAYFGFVQFQNSPQPHLFLSVGLTGEEEAVKGVTWTIKSAYYPEGPLHFTSSLTDTALFAFIRANNFPFYQKDKELALEQKIIKQWFEPEKYKNELVDTLTRGNVFTLLKDFDQHSDTLHFQTYIRESGEFVPLFSNRDMIEKSGMTEIPAGLTVVVIAFQKINEVLGGGLQHTLFVLNPGTAFEVEFTT